MYTSIFTLFNLPFRKRSLRRTIFPLFIHPQRSAHQLAIPNLFALTTLILYHSSALIAPSSRIPSLLCVCGTYTSGPSHSILTMHHFPSHRCTITFFAYFYNALVLAHYLMIMLSFMAKGAQSTLSRQSCGPLLFVMPHFYSKEFFRTIESSLRWLQDVLLHLPAWERILCW